MYDGNWWEYKKINEMSDNEVKNLTPSDVEALSDSEVAEYNKRMDKIDEKELEDLLKDDPSEEESKLTKEEENPIELKNQQEEQERAKYEQIEEELKPAIMDSMYGEGKINKDYYSKPEIHAYDENGRTIVEIENKCNEYNQADLMLNFDEIDIKVDFDMWLTSLRWDNVPKNYDEVRMKTTIYNWHKEGDMYEATTSKSVEDLEKANTDPKVKIEKIN
ncbi:hypothetical protein [Staphylococcus hominis]|uniref:hypothetical protein n=2 Tax=Staphylococcus hominis TaxID=1290 RepID=UPI001E45075A|nr:hypothetical protein [Staphylococcus hominis]